MHGAFAAHAKWMQPGSALRNAISDENTAVLIFCWRGRNRQSDRDIGGKDLHEFIVRVVTRYPEAHHHVIGHSHGGNVAL